MSSTAKPLKIVDVLCEFFEVAIHNILYVRKLYPESIFVRKRKYGVVVYQSIHPEVNEYITQCLRAAEFHAKAKQLRKLLFCVICEGTVTERYVFDVLQLQLDLNDVTFLVRLKDMLRAYCLKLHSSVSYLSSLPEEATFNIQLHTTESSNHEFNEDPVFEDFPWIQVNGKRDEIPYADIVPLNSIDTNYLGLQMYIEKCCK